ncbi:MAG: hypothetical protein VX519_00075, partial [Myxococcota bacterium]|nr:hypothetical protein [Myxococcota bacterium]
MDAPVFELRFLCALSCAVLLGCPQNPPPNNGADADTEDTSVVAAPGFCEVQGLTSVDFAEGPYGSDYGDLAADFELNTLDGTWSFSENWTGCDTYIFLMHADGYDLPDQIWNSPVKKFLDASPMNVHYF